VFGGWEVKESVLLQRKLQIGRYRTDGKAAPNKGTPGTFHGQLYKSTFEELRYDATCMTPRRELTSPSRRTDNG